MDADNFNSDKFKEVKDLLWEWPESHIHWYPCTEPGWLCQDESCNHEFVVGVDTIFAIELKHDGTHTTIRFCLNRPADCSAFKHFWSYRWLRERFPLQVENNPGRQRG